MSGKKRVLKLFIWTGFCPDYSGGMAIAIAKDEAHARKLIIKEYGGHIYIWGDLEVRRLDHTVARAVEGGS